MKYPKIDSIDQFKITKQEALPDNPAGCSNLNEEPLEVFIGLNLADMSETATDLDESDPFELTFEDSSESESETDESELDIEVIMQLKITLKDIQPPIWRRIQVLCNDNFENLHRYVQEVMGWKSCHAHSFTCEDVTLVSEFAYNIYAEMGCTEVTKEAQVTLKELFKTSGDTVLYEYDHGNTWEHEIVFEKFLLLPVNRNHPFPKCVGGERACPPEDCGGVRGYLQLLEVRSNPEHEKYEELIVNWLDRLYPGFDPETFDINTVFKKD
ncbi:uncharacterized protein y4hQ-like isoform X2 [Zophobas morio]